MILIQINLKYIKYYKQNINNDDPNIYIKPSSVNKEIFPIKLYLQIIVDQNFHVVLISKGIVV